MELTEKKKSAAPIFLIRAITEEFARGARLIERLEDDIYRRKANGTGSIGGHFRHNLDFVKSLLSGVETGKIDYGNRERDLLIEENRFYAIERFAHAIDFLCELSTDCVRRKILVRSELDPEVWHESGVARELEFLHSHTVHHHALIAEKLAFFGVESPDDFGVAPSTLKFWKEQNAAASGLITV